MTRTAAFTRPLRVVGWAPSSRWGFDPRLECYWAELRPVAQGAVVAVGPEHLITTVEGLSRAVARVGGVAPADAYLALTA